MKENHISSTKISPIFQVKHGRDFSLENYHLMLDECRKMDIENFGNINFSDNAILPDGLSKKWILINNDIHTFVFEKESNILKGYLSALPIIDSTFEKIKTGQITDDEIQVTDILPFKKNSILKIYLLSIVTQKDIRQFREDKVNVVAKYLLAGLVKKLTDYWEHENIKIAEFVGTTWTTEGERLCKFLGMEKINYDKFGHPIYWVNISDFLATKEITLQGFDLLASSYNKDISL